LVWKKASGETWNQAGQHFLEPLRAGDDLGVAAVRDLGDRLRSRPQERGLREARPDRVRQLLHGEVAVARDEADLERAGSPSLAHDEIAQEARPLAAVERAQPCAVAPVAHEVANLVAAFGGEHAVARIDHALPLPAGVEPEREPGTERVLELVAVAPDVDRGDDRLQRVPR
jgi:hypothetical protein